jgi:hypothetical protein
MVPNMNRDNNQDNRLEIEDLYHKQIRDLTRRTIGGYGRMKMRQTDLDDFGINRAVSKNRTKDLRIKDLPRNYRRNFFSKRYPEDYVYDEDAVEWKNT